MNARSFFVLFCGCCSLLLGDPSGWDGLLRAADLATVQVSRPVVREVTDYADFTGRTQAVQSVNVVARVTGYLLKEPFKEGSNIKAGDLLFEIDSRPYRAQYDLAASKVNLYKTDLKLAQTLLSQDEQTARTAPGSISARQLEQDRAAVERAEAQINVAKASLETYQLNLEFCKVTAPLDGQVSRYYLTPGNLVTQDQTQLTTIVSLDPMYAYVDIDEPTVLRLRRAISNGQIKASGIGQVPVLMGLQGEDGFPHKGSLDFINNQVNPTTGSIMARGIFSNPSLSGSPRLLVAGMFVRIRLPTSHPHPALLVVDRAIGSDQGLKFVFLVKDSTIVYRRIETGPLESDGLRVVAKGLNPDDQVVIGLLQKLRPGMEIKPEEVSMPVLSSHSADGR